MIIYLLAAYGGYVLYKKMKTFSSLLTIYPTSDAAKTLIASFKNNAKQWELDGEKYLNHKNSGVGVYASDMNTLHIYMGPGKGTKFTFRDKLAIWPEFKKIRNVKQKSAYDEMIAALH